MRISIRVSLIPVFLLNLLLFSSLLKPERLTLFRSVQDTLLTLFCVGFGAATLLCLVAFILWSPGRQKHISIRWIRGVRVAAQVLSFSLMSGLLVISVLSFFALHTTLFGVGLLVVLAVFEYILMRDRELTPAHEVFSHRH